MQPDGSVLLQSGTQKLGAGSYTIFTQPSRTRCAFRWNACASKLGDTLLPHAPISVGSQSAASVGNAVYLAACKLRDMLAHRRGNEPLEARADATPQDSEEDYSSHAFGAQFTQSRSIRS